MEIDAWLRGVRGNEAHVAAGTGYVYSAQFPARLTLFSIASSLSGARNRPGLNIGAAVAASASSFSVGSALR